jgi:protein TonB
MINSNENEYQYDVRGTMRSMSSDASFLAFSGMPSDLSTGQRRVLVAAVVCLHAAVGWAWWHSKAESVDAGAAEVIDVSLVTDAQSETREPTEVARPEPMRQPVQPQPVTREQPRQPTPSASPVTSPSPPVLNSQSGVESMATQAAPVAAAAPTTAPTAPAAVASPAPPPPPAPPREFQASAVSYLVAPVLTYPRASRELGEQGSVLLRVLVDERGRPTEIQVVKSSGYPRLDQQAVQAMRAARFKPHVEDGVARPMWVRTPQTFILEDN